MLTLDQIEQTVLPEFHDPRVYLALGRGAIGSGRLRSEAFTAATLEAQLSEVAAECVTRAQCVEIDRANNQRQRQLDLLLARRPISSPPTPSRRRELFANRSPIERAVLAFIEPQLLTTEREFLAKNQFKVVFKPFDWTLNDLTGRGGR